MKNNRIRSFGYSRSLRVQLRLTFMLITFIILAMSAVMTYTGVMDILAKRTNESSTQYMAQASDALISLRNDVDKLTKQLLIDPDIQKFLDREDGEELSDQIILHRDILEHLHDSIEGHDYVRSIYLFAEDGRVIGTTENKTKLLHDPAKREPFYSSALHERVISVNHDNDLPTLVWDGSKRNEEFGRTMHESEGRLSGIVTAARAMKSLYQSKPSATLIINVKEEKLFSLYNNGKSAEPEQLYLCDASSRIISHADKSLLRTQSDACERANAEPASGSLRYNEEQVVYYKLADTDWTMVKAVPVSGYIRDLFQLRYQLIGILILSFIAASFLSSIWIRKITRPMQRLMEAMSMIEKGKLDVMLQETDQNEFGRLSLGFNRMSAGIKVLIEQNRIAENHKRRMEIQMLQAQINPHFLFNTLNTIKWMAVMHKADNIMKSIGALGSLLQPIFKKQGQLCPLAEELDYAVHYIQIMNYRYGEGIVVEFEVSPEVRAVPVPRFVLQPLIENAVLHGFERSGYAGLIRIEAEKVHDSLSIRVVDDGQGMTEERLLDIQQWMCGETPGEEENREDSAFGIGLRNVHRRIRLIFPDSPGLLIQHSQSGGIQTELRIPISEI
ncbi:cache domain-containing sensor histidine kinase [Paenibacillus sp. strain BS8-2]